MCKEIDGLKNQNQNLLEAVKRVQEKKKWGILSASPPPSPARSFYSTKLNQIIKVNQSAGNNSEI